MDRSPWTKAAEPRRPINRHSLAVDELERNGVKWREPLRAAEFVSAPDAADMSPADIANVEALSAEDTAVIIDAVEALLKPNHDDGSWGGWRDDDARWTLTPHELRKLNRRIPDRFRSVAKRVG